MPLRVRGVILAGVHRWRDSALERVVPWPLAPVANVALIELVLRWLHGAGVSDATVCANSDTHLLRSHLRSVDGRVPLTIEYYEDRMPRGPAGCVRDSMLTSDADTCVVADATILPEGLDLADMVAHHRRTGAAITVVVARTGDPRSNGSIDRVPFGVYVFSREALRHIPTTGYQDIKEMMIPRLYAEGVRIETYEAPQLCPRVADVDSYLLVNALMLERLSGDGTSNGQLQRHGDGWVHVSARISPDAQVLGPVQVAEAATVERNAMLVGPTAVGARSRIGAGSVISRSVIWDGVEIGNDVILDRCIVTHGTRIHDGARYQNLVVAESP